MSNDDYLLMREYIDITKLYSENQVVENPPETVLEENISMQAEENPLVPHLKNLIVKLRSHMEDDQNQDIAMGVETGMNRAADMLENLLRQHGV